MFTYACRADTHQLLANPVAGTDKRREDPPAALDYYEVEEVEALAGCCEREEIWPRADRQHCAVHRLRNLQAKLPKSEHDRIRFNYWSALTDATSVKDGKLRLKVLISELEHAGYESAARCLADDLDALVVHLRYPLRHRERWRSTNLLERSLGEVRRRTKVMGRFPGETSCLTLVWAVLDLFFSHASNGATFTDVDRQHLYRIKYQQADPDTLDEEVTAA